jgi:predicted MFS family arabinose efflux permease
MIAAEILAMLGSSAVAATLPELIARWNLTSVEAGWLSGAYFFGYAVAVPILVSLTDRFDARFIFALGCGIGALANAGMGIVAHDVVSGTLLWALAGVSMAGAYMPGLRVITDRAAPALRLRAVPYYTASFGIGISASFFVAGVASRAWGWPAAFLAGGAGCVAALACLVAATAALPPVPQRHGSGRFDLRAVLRNGAAMRFILAYGGHCWELFALRAWLVALLLFLWNRGGGGDPGRTLVAWSSAITLAGVPASILGAELAFRVGRTRLITVVALSSVGIALAIALFGTTAFVLGAAALVIYTVAILGDSGAITAGLVGAARTESQGSTLALHSLVGFVGGGLGPIAVGIALTAFGGASSAVAWGAALVVMAAGSAVAAAAVVRA